MVNLFQDKTRNLVVVFVFISNVVFGQQDIAKTLNLEKVEDCFHERHLRFFYRTGNAGTSFVFDLINEDNRVEANITFVASMTSKTKLNGKNIKCDSVIFHTHEIKLLDDSTIYNDYRNINYCDTILERDTLRRIYLHPNSIQIEEFNSKFYHKMSLKFIETDFKKDSCMLSNVQELLKHIRELPQFRKFEEDFSFSLPPGTYSEGLIQFIKPNKFLHKGKSRPASKE